MSRLTLRLENESTRLRRIRSWQQACADARSNLRGVLSNPAGKDNGVGPGHSRQVGSDVLSGSITEDVDCRRNRHGEEAIG